MAEKAASSKTTYNFGERKQEFVDGHNVDVWQTPKYLESREAAISLLESKDYGKVLTEGDFWILMNKTKSGKMAYTGLIISHDALIKINNALPEDRRFREEYCGNPETFEYARKKGLWMVYRDKRDGMLEVGEISTENCKNGYPYAMLFKRTFDRVVRRKANLIGLYSDSEADEFRGEIIDYETTGNSTIKGQSKSSEQHESAASSEAVNAEKAPDNENMTVKECLTLSLEEALMHRFDGGNVWKGRAVIELLQAPDQTDAQKMKYLNMYQTRGTEMDRAACKVVSDALTVGETELLNSVEAAG